MSQENARVACAISNACVESTFNAVATPARIQPVLGSAKVSIKGNPAKVEVESPEYYDTKDVIQGLKSWELEFEHHVKVLASQLSTGTLSTPRFLQILAAWFGGQSPAEGATVGTTATGSPGTATVVNATSGAPFTPGELLMIQTANGMELCRLESKATNALTLNPGLSTTPTAGGKICNMVNLYPTPGVGSVSSCSFEVALADSANEQYQLTGGIGAIMFKFTRGGVLTISVRARGKSWSRGALSITTTVSSDGMGSSVGWMNNAKLLLQSTATATATHVPFEEITIEYDLGLDFTPDGGGPNEGAGGVVRTGGREFAKVGLKCKMDTQFTTWFSAGTALQVLFGVPSGSGSTRQWIGWYVGNCKIDEPPQPDESTGRRLHSFSLTSRIDTSLSSSLLKAPGLYAVG